MRKVIALILFSLFFITACTTTGFLGLAKESYAKQLEDENAKLKEELGTLKDDIAKIKDLAKDMEKLDRITTEIRSKLDELPEDTIKRIVKILQDYLNDKNGSGSGSGSGSGKLDSDNVPLDDSDMGR